MKKVFCVLLLLLTITAVVSCDNNSINSNDNSAEHVHSFSMWSMLKEASCAEQGVQTRNCTSCGFIEQASISTISHTAVSDNAVAATCTTEGKTAGSHCSVCNAIIVKQNTITAIGHVYDYGVVVSSASCTQKGTIKYTCTALNCDHSYTENYSLPIYTATEINDQALSYVGEIITYDKNGYEQSLGTGFVYDIDGKIITNYHVIDEAYSAKITINGIAYRIESVLAYDEDIDLAVLKINANGLTAANICKNPVKVGETIYAIGSSRGLTNTFSQGIITYADRIVDGVSHIQHDASITNGNSGGPLINQYGEVIGINSWLLTNSQNLNFAVFADELDNLVYGTQKTLAELYEENHNAYDVLLNYVLTYGTYDASNQRYEIEYKDINTTYSDYYSLYYNANYESLWVSNGYFDDGSDVWSVFVGLCFNDDPRGFFYGASYNENGIELNYTYGYLNPSTFTSSTSTLPYESYDGLNDSKDNLMSLYSSCIMDMLDWVEYLLEEDNISLTLADLGFVSYTN